MRTNTHLDMTPFDMAATPGRQSAMLLPLVWLASFCSVRGRNLKIDRTKAQGLKPPYLVLSMHQGFTDYFITPLSLFPHRASYVSDMEGFANYGKRLYSMIGCIPTRRFIASSALVRGIRHAIVKNGDIVVLFPEARHSNVGTNSELPPSIGKLVKLLHVPVVVQKLHGSYLSQPIWDERNARRAPLEAVLECILMPEEIDRLSAEEITFLVNHHFSYDDYRWQYENRIVIDNPNRAQGLDKVLYQCPHCLVEYRMQSLGDSISCAACGKQWVMDVYGRIAAVEGETEFAHIPDWYEFEREQVKRQIERGEYALSREVVIEALPNEKGFVPLGKGILAHTAKGFTLTIESSGEYLRFPSAGMPSVHTEYGYREKGDCIVLSKPGCCYYLYANGEALQITKAQFAAEFFNKASAR